MTTANILQLGQKFGLLKAYLAHYPMLVSAAQLSQLLGSGLARLKLVLVSMLQLHI